MTYAARWTKAVLAALLLVGVIGFAAQTQAADLPLASASPLTGVAFDDRPLLLPVERNFQMALLTASSELGRSCGRMEAYGWRMNQSEQARVNQIFNNTVDRLRLMGYNITPQVLASVSNDITLFTADSPSKHFLFLWSAGNLGLVLNLCQTSAPLPSTSRPIDLVPSVQVFPMPMDMDDVVPSRLGAIEKKGSGDFGNFTPSGDWVGGYTCAQGYTGGTLQIGALRGKNFEGVFKFYPTVKNPSVPPGSYNVYGQYDAASKRILINPGKWIHRPKNFYNTVIVGSFDAVRDTFSAYFQGITGCTSFEASRLEEPESIAHSARKHKKRSATKHSRRKKPAKKSAKKRHQENRKKSPDASVKISPPVAAAPAEASPTTVTAPAALPPAPKQPSAAPAASAPPAPTSVAAPPAPPVASGTSAPEPGIPLSLPTPDGK